MGRIVVQSVDKRLKRWDVKETIVFHSQYDMHTSCSHADMRKVCLLTQTQLSYESGPSVGVRERSLWRKASTSLVHKKKGERRGQVVVACSLPNLPNSTSPNRRAVASDRRFMLSVWRLFDTLRIAYLSRHVHGHPA